MNIRLLKFSRIEIRDLAKAWFAISLAFAIAMSGLAFDFNFINLFLISAFTVGSGFLLHELSHKYLAQKYGCFAEFRSFDKMLVFAILLSFLGFIFAAPGGVFIQGHIDHKKNGKISAAGIVANLALALVFLLLFFITPFTKIAFYGLYINSWLAIFNLIPFGNFDGIKVLAWSKKIYVLLVIFGFVLMAVQTLLSTQI
jgi:Zn-dependent protease